MLGVTSSVLLASVLVWFNYSAVLPLIVEEWGLSGTRAGIVFAAFQAGYLVAILPAGLIADRYSPRWALSAGAVGTGTASLAFGLVAAGFASGTLLRFVSGIFMAGVYVPGMRFVSDWYPSAIRGRALGLYVGTFSVASGPSFLVSATVAAAVGWRSAIVVTSLGAIVIGPMAMVLTHDHPEAVRSRFHFDPTLLRDRDYLLAVGIYTGHNWELFGVRNWIQAFLVGVPAFAVTGSPALTGVVVGIMMALGGVGNVLGGWLSDRFGRLPTIGLMLGSSGLITLTIGRLGWLPLPALVVLVFLYGIVITGDSAPTSTTITEIVDDAQMGAALSIQSLVGFTVTVISPVVFGIALDRSGYALAFVTLVVGPLAALAFVGLLHRRRSIREPDESDARPN